MQSQLANLRLFLFITMILSLTACVGGGDGDGDDNEDDSAGGLGDTPGLILLAFPNDLPTESQRLPPRGIALFQITGLATDTLYRYSIEGTNNIGLTVFDEIARPLCQSNYLATSQSCLAVTPDGPLFVEVADVSGMGSTFTLDIIAQPVNALILPNDLPAAGQAVTPVGVTLFEISGLTPGTFYEVSVTGTNDTDLVVMDDSAKSLCKSSTTGVSENCIAIDSGNSLLVQVDDVSGLGSIFDLDVSVAPITTLTFPGDLPAIAQTVDPGEDALFEIAGLRPDAFYSVSITGTNNSRLSAFNDDGTVFFGALCSLEQCTGLSSGDSLLVQVDDASGLGNTFDLNVTVVPITTLTFPGDLPAMAQTVDPGGDALFEIAGLTPGTIYEVSIVGDSSIKFRVFEDINPFFFHHLCDSGSVTGTASCNAAPSGTSLFVQVQDSSNLGNTFSIDVAEPTIRVLNFSRDLPAMSQTVSPGGDALFQITGLATHTEYQVTIAGAVSTDFRIYVDDAFVDEATFIFCKLSCLARTRSDTSLYLSVHDSSGLGNTFDIDVAVPIVTVLNFPGALPAADQILAPGGIALFEISNVTPGTSYNVSVEGSSEIDILIVYKDSNFASSSLCMSYILHGSGQNCIATAFDTSLFLYVGELFLPLLGNTYMVDVTEEPP